MCHAYELFSDVKKKTVAVEQDEQKKEDFQEKIFVHRTDAHSAQNTCSKIYIRNVQIKTKLEIDKLYLLSSTFIEIFTKIKLFELDSYKKNFIFCITRVCLKSEFIRRPKNYCETNIWILSILLFV